MQICANSEKIEARHKYYIVHAKNSLKNPCNRFTPFITGKEQKSGGVQAEQLDVTLVNYCEFSSAVKIDRLERNIELCCDVHAGLSVSVVLSSC